MMFTRLTVAALGLATLTATAPTAVAATQHNTVRAGEKAEACILHRESRGRNVPPNHAGASGYYQFTRVAWNATVKRMGKPEWANRHASTFTRKQQRAVYLSAWKHGNGKFYWSARWGAPYACFPGDTRPMRGATS